MSHFYLTLPSNSSQKFYPDNTLTHFTTRLHNAVNLQGMWEVGLSEISFPRTWHNIGKNEYITITCESCEDVEPRLAEEAKNRRYTKNIKIKRGFYDSIEDLLEEINKLIKLSYSEVIIDWVGKTSTFSYHVKEESRPIFYYNKANRRVRVDMHGHMELSFTKDIAEILGVARSENPVLNNSGKRDIYNFRRISDISKGVNSLYIYCDLLEHVPVGDTLAPLLRICDAQGLYGKIAHLVFDKPRYVPVQKKHFHTVEIDIRDCYGKKIPFESGELFVTLHFRRTKEGYFF